MKIKPLNDRIVCVREVAEDKSKGGIIIPDAAKEKPQRARVVAVGEGVYNERGERNAMQVEPGDVVLFTTYAGNEVEIDGEKFLILRECDVLAVVG